MAGQVASSKRNQGKGGQRPQGRSHVPEPKILRIGIIHNGRIVEERLIPHGQAVTVGESQKSTIVVSGVNLPNKRFELFVEKGGRYSLNFTQAMHGKVALGDQIKTLAALASGSQAKKRGNHHALGLNDRNRGKVYVGDHTILFQFVTPPPQPMRARASDFRAFRWDEVDWVFLAILLLSALLHTAAVVWIESQPPPKQMRLEDFPDRFVRLLLQEDPPEVEEVVSEDAIVDESLTTDAEEAAPEEAPPEEAPGEGAEEDPGGADEEPAESAEDRRERLEDEVSSKGLLAIIGTTGASSSSDGVADLLSDASALSDDVGSALARSSGVAIGRRDSDQSGLRGGGGGDEAAGIGDLGAAKGGSGGSVTKAKTEVKGKVGSGTADIIGSPEEAGSIKKTMNRYAGRVKQCYERELKGDPDLKGKVVVSFTIATSGSVSGVGIEDNTTGNSTLGDCIKREIARIRFTPAPEDEIEVAGYPFILSSQ